MERAHVLERPELSRHTGSSERMKPRESFGICALLAFLSVGSGAYAESCLLELYDDARKVSGAWWGSCKEGKAYGYGAAEFADGGTYLGDAQGGRAHGSGEEVTREEFGRFVSEAAHSAGESCWTFEGEWKVRKDRNWKNPGFRQGEHEPVVCVSWKDARAYVEWLSEKTGEVYRLPSESEWEYVARAGTTPPFHYGRTISTNQANYNGHFKYGSGRKGEYRGKTVPVGSFPPNVFGLHDVHGNVDEWVEDCWHDSYDGAPSDGSAWTSGGDCSSRVLRGGSWLSSPEFLRSAHRNSASNRYVVNLGFRVARTLTP